jgi:hypothetical protein
MDFFGTVFDVSLSMLIRSLLFGLCIVGGSAAGGIHGAFVFWPLIILLLCFVCPLLPMTLIVTLRAESQRVVIVTYGLAFAISWIVTMALQVLFF